MLIRILTNESLHSYIERNIICSLGMADVRGLGNFNKKYLCTDEIEKIASILGFEGCYGFNRLLHEHTHYPSVAIFKNTQDIAYSQGHYFFRNFWVSSTRPKYCPVCAKEDIIDLGYSYWRRFEHKNVNVCAIHNVVLEDQCFVCGKGFCEKGHGLDVMWNKCRGHHLAECPVRINTNQERLVTAKLIRRVFEFEFHFPEELVVDLLLFKLKSKLLISNDDIACKVYASLGWRRKDIQKTIDINSAYFPTDNEYILTALLQCYDDFDEFLDDVNELSDKLNSIDEFWGVYRTNKGPIAHYIREHPFKKPNEWFIPFPRPPGYKTRGREAWPFLNKGYSCCNF